MTDIETLKQSVETDLESIKLLNQLLMVVVGAACIVIWYWIRSEREQNKNSIEKIEHSIANIDTTLKLQSKSIKILADKNDVYLGDD